MRLAKGVTAKTLDLPPHFIAECFRVALGSAIVKIRLPQAGKSLGGTFFAGHHAAHHVGFVEPHAGKMVQNFHHIFLVDHHPESFLQVFLKYRMQVLEGIRIVEALNVLAHHARLCHTRADDAAGCHEVYVRIATQFA